ncbi:MAG: alpha/beta hydrolase [Bacteroidota bacterium]
MKHLLLLHGALGSKNQFDELKTYLTDHFKIHDLNFSGHGGRPAKGEFGNELFAENIDEYLSEYNIDQCSIFGYSMGGYAALYFAKEYPQKVDKIMTLATKFNWTPESAAKEVKMLNPEKIAEKVPHFADLLKKRHGTENWESILQKTAAMMLALGNGDALTEHDFKTISCETLVAVGDADRMVSIDESAKVANLIPSGKLKVLNGVEHPIEKVNKQILANTIILSLQ